jgi:ABC-2 type transport system permease protein
VTPENKPLRDHEQNRPNFRRFSADRNNIRVRLSSYRHLVMARVKELQREPEVIFWVFIFPLLLALGLGIAFREKPADKISIAVVDGVKAKETLRQIQRSLKSVKAHIASQTEAFDCFRLGKCDIVVIPHADGSLEYQYDPGRAESELAQLHTDNALQALAGRKNPIVTFVRKSSEPGSRYIDFLIPGLIGMNSMNSGMWGMGFALVEMRQRKLLKRFVATPMRRGDFLLALITSRLVLMVLEIALVLGFGALVFDMRIAGSWVSILGLGALGAIVFGGLGLLAGSRTQKIETVSGLINLVMMPMWIFSGVFFSYERFPEVIHPFIRLLPLTALNDALRAAILEGAPFSEQVPRLVILVLWGGISFVAALRIFRWT